MIDVIQEQWLIHAKGSNRTFMPVDVGFPARVKDVMNEEYFLDLIKRQFTTSDVYCSVYDKVAVWQGTPDKVYIDVDSDPNHLDLKLMRKICNHFKEKYGFEPRVYFTGCRGFAIYLDFEKIQLKNFECLRDFVLDNLREMKANLEYIDTSVLGDKQRLSRLPFTFNFKNLQLKNPSAPKLCIPIEPDWGKSEILEQSIYCEFKKKVEIRQLKKSKSRFFEEIRLYEERVEEMKKQIKRNISNSTIKVSDEVLNKLIKIAQQIKDGRHRLMHFIIIPTLIQLNKTDDEIRAFCRDFVERTGMDYSLYDDYVERSIKRNRAGPNGDGVAWRPLSFEKFFIRNVDLQEYFRKEEGVKQ
ncbi:MAG: hypothetical protein QXI58_02605 [Candidatus Micrarchaeia archaeon]